MQPAKLSDLSVIEIIKGLAILVLLGLSFPTALYVITKLAAIFSGN